MSMKINNIILLVIIILLCRNSMGQSFQFQPDKPGKFILQNKLNKCSGLDIASLSNKLTAITEWVRQNNTLVHSPTGFYALISLSGNFCDKRTKNDNFGIQSSTYFSFHHFYLENGVSKTATGNTAHGTTFLINNPINLIGQQYTETVFQTNDPPRLKDSLDKAVKNLQKYYSTATVLKEIGPGVRLYATGSGWSQGSLLVFNPDRTDIWIPVTVKEILEAKLAYYKIKQEIDSINYEKVLAEWAKLNFKPDRIMRPNLYDVMKKEFENFTPEELNRPAFSSARSGISTINALGEGRPVMKFNSASWDRTLPVTAVQFMSLQYRPAKMAQLEEFKQGNQGLTDYVGLFFNKLPVEKMGVLIQRK